MFSKIRLKCKNIFQAAKKTFTENVNLTAKVSKIILKYVE